MLDLPDEVLDSISQYLDADSLGKFARTNKRLLSSAIRCLKHLGVTAITPDVQDLFRYGISTVRTLDLSNCISDSSAIQLLILKCQGSIKELNVVNCNLALSQLMIALRSLPELKTLSFSSNTQFCVETWTTLEPLGSRPELYVSLPSIRKVYVEMTSGRAPMFFVPSFLNLCTGLEELHVNLIGRCRLWERRAMDRQIVLEESLWQHLRTVVFSCHERVRSFIPLFLDILFRTRLENEDLDHWQRSNSQSGCFIYENGNYNAQDRRVTEIRGVSLLKDAYHLQFQSPVLPNEAFPFGSPRGLKIDCRTPETAQRVTEFLSEPMT